MANPFTYLELHSTAPDKAKAFYAELFDWKTSDVSVPAPQPFTYTEIDTKEGPPAGLIQQMTAGAPSHWLAYVLVPDLDAAARKAAKLGARVVRERQEVKDMGWFAVILDPTGAPLGLWQKMEAR
jgi:predicted enzyme related to lactoylglutathione lyase